MKILCDTCDRPGHNFLRARARESYGLIRHVCHATCIQPSKSGPFVASEVGWSAVNLPTTNPSQPRRLHKKHTRIAETGVGVQHEERSRERPARTARGL